MNPPHAHALHAEAMKRGQTFYVDPETGYKVFTALGHWRRGTCCGSGCRHCPFGHAGVPDGERAEKAQVPTLMNEACCTQQACDVLFWSGGKDSYLAYRYVRREPQMAARDIVLLTTFDGPSRIVAHQEIAFPRIHAQSVRLRAPLLGIPLYPGLDYLERIAAGLELLCQRYTVRRLVFGDLHVEPIRQWREKSFGPLAERYDLVLHFPIWHRSYEELLHEFVASGASAEITAAPFGDFGHTVQVGDRFGPAFVARLPDEVDGFGENGEFHTCVSWER